MARSSKFLLAIMIVLVLALTACSSGNGTSSSAAAPSAHNSDTGGVTQGSSGELTQDEQTADNNAGATGQLHSDIVAKKAQDEVGKQEQSFLAAFRANPQIQKALQDSGANVDQVTPEVDPRYTNIIAYPIEGHEWADATIRVDFPTNEGRKRFEAELSKPFRNGQKLDQVDIDVLRVGFVTEDDGMSDVQELYKAPAQ